MKSKKSLILKMFTLGFMAVACSAERLDPVYDRPKDPTPIEPSNVDYSLSPVELLPPSSCSYLEQILDRKEEAEGTFQFFDQLLFDGREAIGSFKFANLPQARFAVSKENGPAAKVTNTNESINEEDKEESVFVALNRMRYSEAVRRQLCDVVPNYCAFQKELRAAYEDIEKLKESHPNAEKRSRIKNLQTRIDTLNNNILSLEKKYPLETQEFKNLEIEYLTDDSQWKNPRLEYVHLRNRNKMLTDQLEEKFPGAITGQARSLQKAPFYKLLVLALNGVPLSSEDTQQMFELSTEYPLLFKNWHDRHIDLRISLALINRNNASASRSEKACQYLLAQRVIAQILTIKGIRGTPRLNANGRIQPLASDFDTEVDYEDVLGVYPKVVDGNYIKELMYMASSPTTIGLVPRIKGGEKTQGLIDAVRFFTALTSFRTENVWALTQADYKPGRTQISAVFLNLGFGLFGINLTSLKFHELVNPSPLEIKLRGQDTQENLAKLGRLNVETVYGLDGLRDPKDLANSLLAPAQIQQFTASMENGGILASLKALETVIAVEGMRRIRSSNEDSEALRDTIHVIGEHLDNDYLKTF